MCLSESIDPNTFYDHIRFYNRINQFEAVKWTSNTYEKFQDEHLNWTDKIDFYTKGEYKRTYNEEFIKRIQEDGVFNKQYYPVVLTTSKEYNQESFIQSNCVKGYINRPDSLIISLRKGDVNSKERATIEYRIEPVINNRVTLRRVQTLGRFNQRLSEEWETPIHFLDEILENLVTEKIFQLPNLEVNIANKVVKSKCVIVEDLWPMERGYLKWENTIPDFVEPNFDDLPY